ncbi:MAG: nucleotidyltransferase domain-containing protein [Betaproteobacteria bacterium]|nr:nucleotidyltransferase domain-containing protein [Betaproteobacteria bacterium]
MNPMLHLPDGEIARFCRAHAVRELALFGSATRADFHEDSDVDVLIDLKSEARIGLIALQRMRDELSVILGRSVDLVTRNGLNRHIREGVLKEAEVIYAE